MSLDPEKLINFTGGAMRKIAQWAAIVAVLELAALAILLHSTVRDFLWAHPWWHSFVIALPAIVFSGAEWWDARETTRLREANNGLAQENNRLQGENNQLNSERNEHLQQIAQNTTKEMTPSEKNAATLRGYLRKNVVVKGGAGGWAVPPEIVEVSEDNLVVLFTPHSHMSGQAFSVTVNCADLEIVEVAQGACPIRLKIIKLYGDAVSWGEAKTWEEREVLTAASAFVKGDNVRSAQYNKPGSSERRSLNVYRSKLEDNFYMLEASTGEKTTGDKIKISKDFACMSIDFLAAGFQTAGSSQSGERLYL